MRGIMKRLCVLLLMRTDQEAIYFSRKAMPHELFQFFLRNRMSTTYSIHFSEIVGHDFQETRESKKNVMCFTLVSFAKKIASNQVKF